MASLINKFITYVDADRGLVWIVTATILSVLPHIPRIPFWISLYFFVLAVWRLLQKPKQPQKHTPKAVLISVIKLTIAACMFVSIFVSYGTLLGRDAGIALLIALAGMKISEISQERDFYITSFIAFFLILTNFFYSQNIIMAVYMFISVTFILFALIDFNDQANIQPYKQNIKYAGSLLLQSIPLLIILYLLFPRIPGPLWSLPEDAHSGITGLSDTMSPGSISKLTLSNAVAFRVEFHSAPPDQADLYWRGPVLWYTDGTSWSRNRIRLPAAELDVSGEPVEYNVIMEPSNQRWLFALEMPIQRPARSFFTHDRQIRTFKRIQNRRSDEMQSWTRFTLGAVSLTELTSAKQLPHDAHQRSVALARSWRAEGLSAQGIIDRALNMFREDFSYTLKPPLLLEDTVDEFLFDTRQGFCEHYAAAFVILMRAAGVPARVVTGYQGGVFNPIGHYLIVRQRDAHAWAEVWLEDKGWTRVDPTSTVAPTRIETGIETALPEAIIDISAVLNDNGAIRDFWLQMRNRWDAINNQWNKWVMAYDQKSQNQFLEKLGLKKHQWQILLVSLGVILLLLTLGVALLLFKQQPTKVDAARKHYDHFCKKMARCGLTHNTTEGPLDFAQRIAKQRPDLQTKVIAIAETYIAVRYGGEDNLLDTLRLSVKNFQATKTVTS